MTALLTAIVLWLSANFDLPANYEHPHIEQVPKASIGAMHYGSFLARDGARVPDEHLSNIVAVYSDVTKTIYLPEDWTGKSPEELSVLVHEMVHHLQNAADIKFNCPQEREKMAFAAQSKWLEIFGKDLAQAFDIDPLTLLVRTNCAN
jgi:hypothetical protein